MKAIVVVDKDWGIGKDGCLLAHLSGDLKHFKEKTMDKVVVMGRATLQSLPDGKPLPNRTNIVLTTNPDFEVDCSICKSKDQLLKEIKPYDMEDVFIIGGEQVYREFLPYIDTIYVTKIDATFPADRYFVNLDEKKEWEPVYESEPLEESGISYRFTEYRRR